MEIIDFIIVTICGVGIGVLSGMFGIGGGGMIVPLLHIAFGLPMVNAAATSLLTIAPTGISGSLKHLRQKTASLKTGLLVGGFGAAASVASSLVAGYLPEYITVLLTVVVILFSVGMMLRSLLKSTSGRRERTSGRRADKKGTDLSQSSSEQKESRPLDTPPSSPGTKEKGKALELLLPVGIGIIAGGIAGIVGVGGGFIIVPFCVAYLGFSLKKAAGTSLVSISIIAIPGIISHALLGHIWWLHGLAIMLGTVPGALLGAWLINRLPERPMRFAFATLLALIGILMLAQEFVM